MKDILPAKVVTRKRKKCMFRAESGTCTFLLPYIKLFVLIFIMLF